MITEILGLFSQSKKDVITKLASLGINKNYIINKDYSVDITGDVIIKSGLISECPVVFNTIHGDFTWHFSNLKSMKNLPIYVMGNMSVSNNKIRSLKDSKIIYVKGSFICSNNNLEDLVGSPKECGSFYAMSCSLKSLKGSPVKVNKEFNVSRNLLKSIDGGPKIVGETYDCSYNYLDINNLEFPKDCKKIISINQHVKKIDESDIIKNDMPLKVDSVPNIISGTKIQIGEYALYTNDNSIYYGMNGKIIKSRENITDIVYSLSFRKIQNETLKEDVILHNVIRKYLEPIKVKFKLGDYVLYNNSVDPNYKFNNIQGEIVEISIDSLEPTYKIKFQYSENPGLKDKVSDANKIKSYVNLKNINYLDIELISKPKSITITNNYLNDNIDNKLNDSTLLSYDDPIIYISNDMYNGWKGRINGIYYKNKDKLFNIDISNSNGSRNSLYGVSPKNLKFDFNYKPKVLKFKKGDKVIYISRLNDTKYKDKHLFKGEITFINAKQEDYDVRFYKQKNLNYETTSFNIKEENLIPLIQNYEVGDKVIYDNIDDIEFHEKQGIITKKINDTYHVAFNDGDYIMTITDITSEDLIKFIKPDNQKIEVGDSIIFTKPDNIYYGSKGVVISYDEINKNNRPYEIEIKDKRNNNKIRIRTNDENLELMPPVREYKRGDIIRYINNDQYDGLIGEITNVIKNDKIVNYDITLKSKNDNIYLTTDGDNLMLLEETTDSVDLKYGQKVKYYNPGSKYHNIIGIYQGERNKDGKIQRSIRFDKLNSFKTIFFDLDEAKLIPVNQEQLTDVKVVPDITTNIKKKKKKEKDMDIKPILVYNRRYTAKRTNKKKINNDIQS